MKKINFLPYYSMDLYRNLYLESYQHIQQNLQRNIYLKDFNKDNYFLYQNTKVVVRAKYKQIKIPLICKLHAYSYILKFNRSLNNRYYYFLNCGNFSGCYLNYYFQLRSYYQDFLPFKSKYLFDIQFYTIHRWRSYIHIPFVHSSIYWCPWFSHNYNYH